jgi:hypothetical protein
VALLGLEVALIPDRRTTLAGIDSRPETSPAFRNGLDAVRRPQQVGQATALAAGWLDVAVLVGQLTGDALPQTVEMTHELGQGTGGAHGRAVGADGFEQGENLKLLVVAQSLGVAHRCLPLGACLVGIIDQHAPMDNLPRQAMQSE